MANHVIENAARQQLGRAGGLARARSLTAEQRSKIARLAAKIRWSDPHIEKPAERKLGRREIAYFRERLKGRMFSIIIKELQRQHAINPIINADWIARRLGRRVEQVNYWLAEPTNLTLDELSDLFLVLFAGEPVIETSPIDKSIDNR